eukprot:CAMPEP_0196580100 /NCGR_PEP_ID=MMETSP1081-20130531/26969_1 /TAXON_ID=36882 /ORGANISM="Pyramimonas amylifera, Strain CCMP720" /LENGTH=211 /DNA_ID=CAMNT_0041899885 /DNA_START=76 /DNA_END=711 /DNA_ORIENTATION=+
MSGEISRNICYGIATLFLVYSVSVFLPAQSDEVFLAKFEVVLSPGNYGTFTMEVHPEWAPLGAARFKELVEEDFFVGMRFFRVLPNFVVQWGIHGLPSVAKKWKGKKLPDEKVIESNKKGYVSFAKSGPHTRTTQMFINFKDNANLDGMGFPPFARVIEGMDVVEAVYSGYGESPDQARYEAEGNKYIKSQFPKLSFIRDVSIVSSTLDEL